MKKILFALLVFSSNLSYAQLGPGVHVEHVNPGTAYITPLATGTLVTSPTPPTPPTTITTTTTPVTAAQWHFGAGINATDVSGALSRDWVYSLITTDKKEYIACGYGLAAAGAGNEVGVIFKLDHLGNLVWEDAITTANTYGTTATLTSGTLWQVAKANDGYVAVGFSVSTMLIVEVNEDGGFINGTPLEIDVSDDFPTPSEPTLITSGLSGVNWGYVYDESDRAYSVAVDPTTNSVANIIVGGETSFTDDVTGIHYEPATIVTLNYSATAGWSVGHSFWGGNNYQGVASLCGSSTTLLPMQMTGDRIERILTKVHTSGGGYDIYGCGAISGPGDNAMQCATNLTGAIPFQTFDKDIWLLKIPSDFSAITFSESFNKNNIYPDGAGGLNLNTTYPGGTPVSTFPYQEMGPLTARNFSFTGPNAYMIDDYYRGTHYYSPATTYLNAVNNENEEAEDMTFTADGNIALIAAVNIIGADKDNNGYTDGSVENGMFSGTALGFSKEYQDEDAFLLKFDLNGDLLHAKNVGHFSGENFTVCIKQDVEGHYIIGGSSCDQYNSTDFNLPNSVSPFRPQALIVVADDNYPALDLSRRAFVAGDSRATDVLTGTQDNTEADFCMFGLDLTADGGYVIGGNNSNNGDDFTVTKFAPLHQELMVGGIGGSYYDFGTGSIPATHTVSGTETWSSSMNVATNVIVPNGATLNITGSGTKISFAASDQLWDYDFAQNLPTSASTSPTIGCGIVVQPGGKLNVTNATLQGISFTGEHNVWDGIVVEGINSPYPAAPPGQVTLSGSGAAINDARYGLFAGLDFRTYVKQENSSGIFMGATYASRYNGTYFNGGGIVTAGATTFSNCYYGANFETYEYPDPSTITGCTFTGDAGGMGDVCFYTTATGAAVPPNTHIGVWNTEGVGIYNNTFTCNTAFPLSQSTTGVQAVGSYVNISNNGSGPGNSFTNLGYGVIASMNGSANISWNTFDNNANAINASGGGIVIQQNTIKVPTLPTAYNGTGITLAGASGYNVSNNTIDRSSAAGTTYGDLGIVTNDGHTENEMIASNTFNYIRQAAIALQTNGNGSSTGTTGLQYHCNTFQYSITDIARLSAMVGYSSTPGTINNQQGYCGTGSDPTTSAGNWFNLPCSVSDKLVGDFASGPQVVTYHSNIGGTAYDPSPCYNSTLYVDNPCTFSGSVSFSTACPVPPNVGINSGCFNCANISPAVQTGTLTGLDAAMATTTDPGTLAALQAEHDQVVNDLVLYYASDTSYDSAAALLAYYGRYRDALNYYMYAGDYTDANTMYQNLPLATTDDQLYAWEAGLMLNLYSEGLTWADLDTASADSMLKITQYNSPAGYMAGAITALLGLAPVTWPVPVLDTAYIDSLMSALDTSQNSERTTHSTVGNGISPIANASTQSFSVYPNPTYGGLTISTTMSGRFTLYTVLGQQLAKYTVTSGVADVQLPAGLAPGIYVGEFKPDTGGEAQKIRLVYQP